MGQLIVGCLSIAVGIVGCFNGYAIFRILLPLFGGILGYFIGANLAGPESGSVGVLVGVGTAVVLGVLAYTIWGTLVVLGGALLGFGGGLLLGMSLQLSREVSVVLGLILALVAGALFLAFKDPAVMANTAFTGAGLALYGIGLLAPSWADLLGRNQLVAGILWTVLGCAGFFTQYRASLIPRRRGPGGR